MFVKGFFPVFSFEYFLQTILIASSTGATIETAAALDPKLAKYIHGLILISPNYGINNMFARMLTWPSARLWVPLIIGKTQSSKIRNKLHEKYWTTKYPTAALFPMAALVKKVTKQDFSKIKIPTLFYFSYQDKVIDPFQIKKIAGSYIEFAERNVLPEFADLDHSNLKRKHRREGFETSNADKIFESTFTSQLTK